MRFAGRALVLLCFVAACGRSRTAPDRVPEANTTSGSAAALPPVATPAEPAEAAPTEPCAALRPLFEAFIRSQADDARAQAEVTRCVESRTLEERTRVEVEQLLGPGRPTAGAFESFGVQPDDVFYEVGRFETPHPGGVPNLIIDFDDAGRCTRALSIHSM